MYRHKTDLVSLIFGFLFAVAAVVTMMDTDIPWDVGRWIGPVVLILFGFGMLIPAWKRLAAGDVTRAELFSDSEVPPAELAEAEAELPPPFTD